jgi:hypothetical protein
LARGEHLRFDKVEESPAFGRERRESRENEKTEKTLPIKGGCGNFLLASTTLRVLE